MFQYVESKYSLLNVATSSAKPVKLCFTRQNAVAKHRKLPLALDLCRWTAVSGAATDSDDILPMIPPTILVRPPSHSAATRDGFSNRSPIKNRFQSMSPSGLRNSVLVSFWVVSSVKMEYMDAMAPMGGTACLSAAEGADSAIIFVHGFKGHPLKTWGRLPEIACAQGAFWEKADLYFFPYKAEKLHVDQSAHMLRKFLSSIFPDPPVRMFARSLKDYDWTLSLSSRLPEAQIRPGPYHYSKLYLVGHSLGGLIIRRFVADELQPFVLSRIQLRTHHRYLRRFVFLRPRT